MALVADAVNHFFRPPHQSTELAEQTQRSQTPASRSATSPSSVERLRDSSQSRAPMSTSSKRGATSPVPSHNVAGRKDRAQEERDAAQQDTTAGQSAPPPLSPPLPARSAPSVAKTPQPSSNSPAQDTSTTDSASEGSVSATDDSDSSSPRKIKVRDLAHIQSIASSETGRYAQDGQRLTTQSDSTPQYEISGMPIENIIEMVAGLLTKITTTNDVQHEHLHRQMPSPESSTSISQQTSSVLAFHGKNVPSITILSYLNRINKYCPTSYEVFLSLLVYFDRMTEKVNAGPIQSLREANQQGTGSSSGQLHERQNSVGSNSSVYTDGAKETGLRQTATPPLSGDLEKQRHGAIPGTPHSRPHQPESPPGTSHSGLEPDLNLAHFFVVDSFNIHRLVIAGVTCASKFFSDIFYTNSRYAKVGGLPLPELNHLELQFLLLNDFRLSVPVEELEAYGTMLVEFYAREVLAQQRPGIEHQRQNEESMGGGAEAQSAA